MNERLDTDFCIEIDYQRGSGSPSRVFRTMSDLIDALQETDRFLIRSIDAHLEPVLLLEDVETSSVKAWIRQALESVDEDALKSGDYKKVVGTYLVKSKHAIIRFLDKKTDITDKSELVDLEKELNQIAQQTEIKMLPAYEPIPRDKLVQSLEKINSALAPLSDDDSASFISSEGIAEFNLTLNIAPETISDLITSEKFESISTMIMKVKKPDFLGTSQWEFRWDNRTICVSVLDADWLQRYQAGHIAIVPGDAIRGTVLTQVLYGFDREVVATHYSLQKVDEVIRKDEAFQNGLFEPAENE